MEFLYINLLKNTIENGNILKIIAKHFGELMKI